MTDEQVTEAKCKIYACAGELAAEVYRLRLVLTAMATKEKRKQGQWDELTDGWNAALEYVGRVARIALDGDPNVWPFLAETLPDEAPR